MERISSWLKGNHDLRVNYELICQYILADKNAGEDLHRHLRCQKKPKKHYGICNLLGKSKNRLRIDEQPTNVCASQRLGAWELYTTVGKHVIMPLTP